MEEYTQSAFYYIRLLMRWKIQFIVVTILALIASAVFSSEYFIRPRYKSTAIVYPANVEAYSEESTTEQVLQIFQSSTIRDAVIKKFDLAKHYGIDTTKKEGHAALIGVYQAFVSISKTQFESVTIEVTDGNPDMAADMVNEIILQLNAKIRALHQQKAGEVIVMLNKQMGFLGKQMDSLQGGLQELRSKYHILDYNIQVKEATAGYMKALSTGKGLKDIDDLLRNLEEKGGDFYKMKTLYDGDLVEYNKLNAEYNTTMKEQNKNFTYTNIVSTPAVSDKKAYPVRWLIVLISVVSVNVFLLLVVIINDYRKRMPL